MLTNSKGLFTQLPPWSKGVVAVVVIGGLAFSGYKLYRHFAAAEEKKDKEIADNKDGLQADKDLVALRANGIVPTITSSQALTYATRLQETLDGCGENMTTIMSVMSALKNTADVYLLISSYGYRNYRPCAALSPLSAMAYVFVKTIYGGTLPELLVHKLSHNDIEKINSLFRSKAISYQL